ncbi:MAG TPA: ABC transporter substrate-binding protein [Acidimicrobiales bacterium]|nr:ABC transporter substrate-binding protein [Acidimicrobiales bacterium]
MRKGVVGGIAGLLVLGACSSSKPKTTATTAAPATTAASGAASTTTAAPAGGTTAATLPTVSVPPVSGNTTTGVTATEIHVGGIYNKNFFADGPDGFNARIKRENDAGGINGRKIVLDTMLDDGAVADQDLTAGKTLVLQDHEFAVAPVFTTSLGAATFLNDSKVPFFGWSVEPRWCNLNWGFGFWGNDCDLTHAPLALNFPPIAAKLFDDGTLQGHTVGLITGDVDSGRTAMLQFASVWKAGGAKIVLTDSSIPPPPTAVGDWTPYSLKVMTADGGKPPDLIEILGDFGTTLGLGKKLIQVGYPGKILGFTDYDPRIVGTTKGMITLLQYAPFESAPDVPAIATMIKDLDAYKPNLPRTQAVESGWLTADFFIQALKKVGPNLTREALYNAINSGFTYDNGGVSVPVKWPVAHQLIQVGGAFVQDEGTSYKVLVPLTPQGYIPNPYLKPSS